MDYRQAQALAQLEEGRPDAVRAILYDSGYGELAEQWLMAAHEFEAAARSSVVPATEADDETPVSTEVLRAYARMCLSWSRISQLRDQAQGCIEAIN